MFEFKTRPWQCAELSEANSAGGRNSASGRETRKSAFLPSVMPFPPEEAVGTHAAGCHFQLGEGGGIEGHDILGILIFVKHLSLNGWFPTRLLLTSLGDSRCILGGRGVSQG